MANLRIIDINPADSQTIKVRFSDNLATDLTASNVSVLSEETGTPNCRVRSVDIINDVLTINVLPMTPYSRYKVVFQSSAVRFRNIDSSSFLLEDGVSNVKKIIGSEDATNPTRDFLMTTLGSTDGVYDLSRETIVRTILNGLSDTINKARADVRQSKSDNYLSVLVKDEQKTRGFGPWDRLNQEGAYEVVRVGLTPTNEVLPGEISFTSFPYDPISLQQILVESESLVAGNSTVSSTYNGLVLTVAKNPIIKLDSVTIYYESGSVYTYNISQFGYRINSNLYDSKYGRNLLTLENNQIELSDVLLDDPTFVIPSGRDTIVVSYYYKNLGLIVDETSVMVTEVISVVREPAPAQTTVFSLQNAPIVTSSDSIATSAGITFLDPYSATPFLTTHPAFLYEIAFREDGLPKRAGEFSVDYSTGRVYVYGSVNNDGSGDFPPAMTYNYRKSYVSRLDYTYVADTYDLVASPLRDLASTASKISFNFELTLIPDIDYAANVHKESRNERIENRLVALNALSTNHSPVTNVFRIYNETTGEIYKPTRFSKNKVYFSYSSAPKIQDFNRERASFTNVFNESLILNNEFTNVLGTRIFKFVLVNQNIMSATDDVIGSSYNSSVAFSRSNDIFNVELYYDSQLLTETQNTDRLLQNQYQVNYKSGIVYVGVSSSAVANVGTVSYKKSSIAPINSHVISVSNIYYSLTANSGADATLDYSGFSEGSIDVLSTDLDIADERFSNGVITAPYIVYNNTITVTDDIKSLRSVYDAYNLNSSSSPINFAEQATTENNVITLTGGIEQATYSLVVQPGLIVSIPSLSPGISLYSSISVIRQSDKLQLLNGLEAIVGNDIVLDVSSGAVVGNVVDVIYTVALNGGATPIVDYNRGDFYFDYTALTDEILVTYEWGDNVIDFRESTTLNENDVYYVTYKLGAMRDALLNNFGTLIQIPELQAFDEDIDRELYRDILIGALQTFTKGPTIPALKQLVASVTKIDPKITEALFNSWTLDTSYLRKLPPTVLGSPQFVSGKFDQGLRISNVGEGVTLPVSNNLRLEEGTLELFVTPEWNGLDNDANLTFSNLTKDGYDIPVSSIFIGSTSFNPESIDFTINRTDDNSATIGIPGRIYTDVGLFIYYDPDNKQWKVIGKESTSTTTVYAGKIQSSGKVYDVKFITGLGEVSDILRSGSSAIEFEFHLDGYDAGSPDGYFTNDGYVPGYSFDGLQFMADDNHYLVDFGHNANQDRFSLYKDGRGYLVFEVWDKGGFGEIKPERRSVYQVSADISSWVAGITHHVAISWILSSSSNKDEMHLFIDGFEVPNLAKYGNIPAVVSTNRFRTVVPEQVIATATKTSIAGIDLNTTQGNSIVSSSSIDFSAAGILPGDTIEILEQGFTTYIISSVSGHILFLTSPMPATLSDARFSVNPIVVVVQTEIDVYSNIAVFVKHFGTGTEIEIPGTRATVPSYAIERNALNQKVLSFYGNITAGDSVLLKTFGLNHRRCNETVYLWSDESILKTGLPSPINLDDVSVKAILLKLTSIGPSNSSLVVGDFVATFSSPGQPTNLVEGRTLEIRMTGGSNIDWSTANVIINGTSSSGITETITFTSAGKKPSTKKWKTITSIVVTVKPLNTAVNSIAVEVKELYAVTDPEGNNIYPVIRYAYRSQMGVSLQGSGNDIVYDLNRSFFDSDVGALLEITAPAPVAGLYEIAQRIDEHTIQLVSSTGSAFVSGSYGVYKINIGRSGFQNGFMFFERAGFTNVPYILPLGYYEIDYAAYLTVHFNPIEQVDMFFGNDITLQKPVKAVLDELRILNRQLTDTRIGETMAANSENITADALSFAPFRKTQDSLVLLHFDDPLTNDTDYWRFATKEYIQSGESINSKFGHCLVVKDKGLVFENNGYLTTNTEGMIEFWVSPKYDTYNDPNERVYFDAAAVSVENVTSTTKNKVKVEGFVRRVVSIKIAGSSDDYFAGGIIEADGQTLTLNKPLPFQQMPVIVSYVSTGIYGDRLVIKKDRDGFISYTVVTGDLQFQIRCPVFWVQNTWHRIRASFKFNTVNHQDEMRLFIDGEERGILLFGTNGLYFDPDVVFGSGSFAVGSKSLIADINFKDDIVQFSLGQDYTGNLGAQARFDNLVLSNKAINPFVLGGQAKDVYYNTNPEFIYPSIENVFTTFIYNFDQFVVKIDDFAILRDAVYSLWNFDLDVIDSFDIVMNDEKVKAILEALINALKPATSKVSIKYIK